MTNRVQTVYVRIENEGLMDLIPYRLPNLTWDIIEGMEVMELKPHFIYPTFNQKKMQYQMHSLTLIERSYHIIIIIAFKGFPRKKCSSVRRASITINGHFYGIPGFGVLGIFKEDLQGSFVFTFSR